MAQAQARAAALEAAENRANKFDNLVNKKKKERKKREQEKFEKNFNSNGGTLNLNGGTAKSSAQKSFQNTSRTQNNVSFGGFDPTKTVMSTSATGLAANSGMTTNTLSTTTTANNNNVSSFDASNNRGSGGGGGGGSMFSSTLANHHASVDQQQLQRVLQATQTSSITTRNVANAKIKTFSKDETSIIMESSIIFSDAEERGADLDMALALLSSAKDKQMAVKCAETIVKIVKNIANDPTEKKYQKLMLKGKTVREKILMIAGGADVLVAIGFTLTSDRLGIILKYDELDDMLLATLFSIIEAGNQFIEDNKM